MPADPHALDEVYDPATLAAIDAWDRPSAGERGPVRGVRAKVTGGAILAAVGLGLQQVLSPPRPAEIAEVDPWTRVTPDQWVRLHWSADPRRTVAVVDHAFRGEPLLVP